MDTPSASTEELTRRFQSIADKAKRFGLQGKDLARLMSLKELKTTNSFVSRYLKATCRKYVIPAMFCFIALQMLVLSVWVFEWPTSRYELINYGFQLYELDISKEPCIIPVFEKIQDFTRPPVDCSICRGLVNVTKRSKLPKSVFEAQYAYSGVPVIITDGAENWTAVNHFSFQFFKSIYAEDSPVLLQEESHCQFFPYKSNFESLAEVFSMSEDRANLKDGTDPWYSGW